MAKELSDFITNIYNDYEKRFGGAPVLLWELHPRALAEAITNKFNVIAKDGEG